jgi:polyisoprenyl-teichoic acid--peptidoglycan teichoic acid transferase
LPDEGRGIWTRYLLGALLIVAAACAATSVAAFDEVNKVVDAFRHGQQVDIEGLAEADAGKPQTIMIVGSDERAKGARDYDATGRSDTVILVRLDPSKKATAMMSLPRDLKVQIPGHGTDKLNAAYSLGGLKLTLKTVKQFTGLSVNHVVNIDFGGFRSAINALNCVYADIDRRYFNDNSGGQNYATIDLKAGYQRLCGQDALDYVRFRHEDNDLVRSARQQDLLRQIKAQLGVGRIIGNRRKLTHIFGEHTRSDIGSRKAVLRILRLVIASARHPIREVHFEGQIGTSYVTASQSRVKKLVAEFLGVRESKGPRGRLKGRGVRKSTRAPLEDSRAAGRDQALQAVTEGARGLEIFYPTKRTSQALFAGPPTVYDIRYKNHRYRSYRMVIKRHLIGEYYGIQGTRWKNPPILREPSEKRTIGGHEYELFFDGDRLRLVAWRTDNGAYWVSNTLLQTLNERQMLGIARSARSL